MLRVALLQKPLRLGLGAFATLEREKVPPPFSGAEETLRLQDNLAIPLVKRITVLKQPLVVLGSKIKRGDY